MKFYWLIPLAFAAIEIELTTENPLLISPGNIRPNYAGFSMEWNEGLIKRSFTTSESTPKKIILRQDVIQLFLNLKEAVGNKGAPTIRVGGNNGMLSFWGESKSFTDPGSHDAGTRGIIPSRPVFRYSLRILDAFASFTGAKLIIAVPMRFSHPGYARIFAQYGIMKFVKKENLMAIELGNEPNHWMNPNWLLRDEDFNVDEYISEAKDIVNVLKEKTDFDIFQAPATAGCNTGNPKRCWDLLLPKIGKAIPSIKYLAYHRYGNSGCYGKEVNSETLLSDPQSTGKSVYDWIDKIRPQIVEQGQEIVFGEGNAANCVGLGAKLDATLSFATTLWALDNLFHPAAHGVTRANLHGLPSAPYAPIFIDPTTKELTVRPVYYAMIVFNTLLGGSNSSLFRPIVKGYEGDVDQFKAWAVRDTLVFHLVIMHKDLTKGNQIATVKTKGEFQESIQIRRLNAPSITSTSGFKFNGRTFDGTKDGKWMGTENEEYVTMNSNDLDVTVPELSAIVLTFKIKEVV